MSRPLRLGAALVVLYTVVALATGSWAPGRLRPLFDGFASHGGSYGWVKPPKELAKGNRPPDSGQARISFGAQGSAPADAETPDGQVMASIPAGAVPRHPFDAAARLEVRPLDSATLGPLPAGLRPESNAYQVTIAFLPTGDLVPGLATPGTVGLTAAAPADTLLFAADGRTWREVEAKPLNRANALTGPFTQTGYYLAASHAPPRSTGSSGGGAPVGLFVVAAAVPLVLGYLLLGRRRLAERSAPGRTAGRRAKGKVTPTGKTASRKPPPAGAQSKARSGKTSTGRAAPTGKSARKAKAAPAGEAAPRAEAAPTDEAARRRKAAPTDRATAKGKGEPTGKAVRSGKGESTPTGEASPTGEAARRGKAAPKAGDRVAPPSGTEAPKAESLRPADPDPEGQAAPEPKPAPEGQWPSAAAPEGVAGSEGLAAPEPEPAPALKPAPEGAWPLAPAAHGGAAPAPEGPDVKAASAVEPAGEAAPAVDPAPQAESGAPGAAAPEAGSAPHGVPEVEQAAAGEAAAPPDEKADPGGKDQGR
jgi:hypothetical protein